MINNKMGRSIAGTTPTNNRNVGTPAARRDRSVGNVVSSSGSPPTFQVLSGSGTYTSPTGCSYIIVEMVGGGAGGGRNIGSSGIGSPGGNGSTYYRFKTTSGTYSYAVGAAGVGTSASAGNGTAGGDSTFGTAICRGGAAPAGANSAGTNAADSLTYTFINYVPWVRGSVFGSAAAASAGGSSFWGTVSGFVYDGGYLTAGEFVDAFGYGAGGAGVGLGFTRSGDGSPGRILVTEYY
jgi:hypothetical protein